MKRFLTRLSILSLGFALVCIVDLHAKDIAANHPIVIGNAPTVIQAGNSYDCQLDYRYPVAGIVQIQLFNSSWENITNSWTKVSPGAGSTTLSLTIPADTPDGDRYFYQAIVYDSNWGNPRETYLENVFVGNVSVEFSRRPSLFVDVGQSLDIEIDYTAETDGFVQIQLLDTNWQSVASDFIPVVASSDASHLFPFGIPSGVTAGKGYRWQAVIYDSNWTSLGQSLLENVSVTGASEPDEWLPPGEWTLGWEDEFDSGTGNWFPHLGYTPEEFESNTEKGLRWAGDTEDTAWMFSTKEGHHSTNNGELEIEIVCNNPGTPKSKVETAFLITGRPTGWDKNGVVWGGGKFVSPQDANGGEVYICTKVKTNQVVGWSTWFAFWMFSFNKSYNDNPTDGTEVDIIEIPKGQPAYQERSFGVANHWQNGVPGSSEGMLFHESSDPASTDFVDVLDDQWHIYGLHWTPNSMKCYIDGQLCYTFTDQIPTNPVDMMMLLTLEFQKDLWDPNSGDGRIEGPFVSESGNTRVMSKAQIDYVRVYELD